MPLQIGLQRRFDRGIQAMKKALPFSEPLASLSFSVLARSIDRGLLWLLFLLPENIRRYA